MALVRDPEVSARYATDPAGVLADAHLPGVTIADVNNLIPVVTDSLAAATPGFGATAESGNVWTSGAAVAAFDAFDIHLPPTVEQPAVHQPAVTVQSEPMSAPPPEVTPVHPPLDPVNPDGVGDASWHHPLVDPQLENPQPEHQQDAPPSFDLF